MDRKDSITDEEVLELARQLMGEHEEAFRKLKEYEDEKRRKAKTRSKESGGVLREESVEDTDEKG